MKKIFLFILDGCAATQFQAAHTPFLDTLAQEGQFSMQCEAVFPTATFTGHSSILTGTFPERHGMVGNQFYDRQLNREKNFDDCNPNEYILSPTICELFPYPSCSISEPVPKGASLTIKKEVTDRLPIEDQNGHIFNELQKVIASEFYLYVVNFQGVDSIGETKGPNSKAYHDVLQEVDHYIETIIKQLQAEHMVIITADHGMVPVETNIELGLELRKEGFDVRCLVSHRMSHIYAKSDIKTLEDYLREVPYIEQVFNEEEIKKIHLQHERTGDLVVYAKKGFEFGSKKLRGSHGGATKEEIIVPFIFYNSGKEVSEHISTKSVKLVDICPTILDIFGIKTTAHFQGSSLLRQNS